MCARACRTPPSDDTSDLDENQNRESRAFVEILRRQAGWRAHKTAPTPDPDDKQAYEAVYDDQPVETARKRVGGGECESTNAKIVARTD